MAIMKKVIDFFKIKNNSNKALISEQIKELQKDQYLYRQDSRDYTYFYGGNFEEPIIQLASAMLLHYSKKGYGIKSNDGYSSYFYHYYKIKNIKDLHIWLHKNNYLRNAFIHEAMAQYRVSELRQRASARGLIKSGTKAELIERVTNDMSDREIKQETKQCEALFLTEKGEMFLEQSEDLVKFHTKEYGLTIEEFWKWRFVGGIKRKFHDTVFHALNEKIYIYEIKKYYSGLELLYLHWSNSCYDEGRYDLALQNTLYRLYFSTNLSGKGYYFQKVFIEFNGIEKMIEKMCDYEIFNNFTIERIKELAPYFNRKMIDIIYAAPSLPYCIFPKESFEEVVYTIQNNDDFNPELYMDEIRDNYKALIKNIL